MIGNVRSGVIVTVSSSSKVDIRVMHPSRGLPLISIEQEPHLPALQFQRTARSPAWVACSRWMTSRTTSPSFTSTRKSCSSPPSTSPRQTRKLALYPIGSGSLGRVGVGQVDRGRAVRQVLELFRRHVLRQLGPVEQA